MSRIWQLHEAKNRLSEVVEEALRNGPQIITKRGTEVVVVLSYAEYRRMQLAHKKLSEFFQELPLAGIDIDLQRDQSGLRDDIRI
ncbi:MAG: type II toxin-antitoxin system Phd/YefM family antitoxin [Roseiflexaceae bacterium]|nr:type II toxin-antitoxin system Phd/YefM family antitoxin [Roseiflexaceae bacterium]